MNSRIDLNGTWEVRFDDGERGDKLERIFSHNYLRSRTINARIPGDIHDDLMQAGILSDVNLGTNVLNARWVENMHWHYIKYITIENIKNDCTYFLNIEKIALNAEIYVNSSLVGKHNNYFHPCTIDISKYLHAGENQIVIRIESGLFDNRDKQSDGLATSVSFQSTKRPWSRIVQSSHGWDWAPRLLNVGIHGDIYIDIVDCVQIESLQVISELDKDLMSGRIKVKSKIFTNKVLNQNFTMSVEVENLFRKDDYKLNLDAGNNTLIVCEDIKNPKLWWPTNHGEQNLYNVKITFYHGDNVHSVYHKTIGFRHIEIDQSPHPEKGNYFVIKVNHKPIFCKGGNFVPMDIIYSKIDSKKYDTLLDRALEANFNFLRVWGGGLYESDYFYELCDKKGILVWQEFIFACSKYPTFNQQFYDSICKEARYQVRRLSNHPSLIIWCGNNEMELASIDWGYDRGVSLPDYSFFHLTLPRIVNEEDGSRYYQASSPISTSPIIHPNDNFSGDQHPWIYGFADIDFRKYKTLVCRFPNEGGFLGPNALPTVKACLEPGVNKPGSFAWEMHDNSVTSWGNSQPYPDFMVEHFLGIPIEKMSIEQYVYWAGILHGEALTEYIKNFRRRMFDCSSAIFWMFNDCWPTVRSWTTVDYYMRRTPSFYPVKRAFQPAIVVITQDEDKIKVFGVNEGSRKKVQIRFGIFSLQGNYPFDQVIDIELPENQSKLVAEFDMQLLENYGISSHAAFVTMYDFQKHEISRDCLLVPLYKEINWPEATIEIKHEKNSVVLLSSTFAWRVCVDLDGENTIPDNYFDLFPGIPYVLPWSTDLGDFKILHIGNDLPKITYVD